MAKEVKRTVVRPFGDAEIEAHSGKVGGKRNLFEIIVSTDDNYDFHYLVKKPSKSVVMAISEYAQKNDESSIQKLLYGCVLEGDMSAAENDGAIYGALLENINALSNSAKAEIKKF